GAPARARAPGPGGAGAVHDPRRHPPGQGRPAGGARGPRARGRPLLPVPGHGGGDRGQGATRAGGGPAPRGNAKGVNVEEIPRRVEKPWGYEIWWARTDRYVGKILHLKKGESLSLQYHRVKEETIRIESGRLLLETRPAGQEGEL